MTRFLRVVCASVFAMVSCTSCVQQNVDIDKVAIEEIDKDKKTVPGYIEFVTIRVAVIPGSVVGYPGKQENIVERAEMGSVVPLDTGRLLEMGSCYSSTLTENAGLTVQPRDMRFARLGTLPMKPYTDNFIGLGSFLDKKSRDFLVLLYVDRPGVISGILRTENFEGKIHVSFDKAGLHWIKIKQVTLTRYEFDNANPSELVFGILSEPAPSLGLIEDLLCIGCSLVVPVAKPSECTSLSPHDVEK